MNRILLLERLLERRFVQAQGHSLPDAVLEDHRVVPGEIVVKFSVTQIATWSTTTWARR